MPIDKFGRHISKNSSPPYSSILQRQTFPSQSAAFYIWDTLLHHSKCVLIIRGTQSSIPNSLYNLENGGDEYVFPIAGKIESIDIHPSNCQIFLNGGAAVRAKSLINTNINKGDKMSFMTIAKQPLYVQIVLQCPISKNV